MVRITGCDNLILDLWLDRTPDLTPFWLTLALTSGRLPWQQGHLSVQWSVFQRTRYLTPETGWSCSRDQLSSIAGPQSVFPPQTLTLIILGMESKTDLRSLNRKTAPFCDLVDPVGFRWEACQNQLSVEISSDCSDNVNEGMDEACVPSISSQPFVSINRPPPPLPIAFLPDVHFQC